MPCLEVRKEATNGEESDAHKTCVGDAGPTQHGKTADGDSVEKEDSDQMSPSLVAMWSGCGANRSAAGQGEIVAMPVNRAHNKNDEREAMAGVRMKSLVKGGVNMAGTKEAESQDYGMRSHNAAQNEVTGAAPGLNDTSST